MNDAAFSRGEAFRFGWSTAKRHIGFFIVVTLIAYLLPAAINVGAGPISEHRPFLGAAMWLLGMVLSGIMTMGLIKIALAFTDEERPVLGDLFACYPLIFKWVVAYIVYGLIVVAGLALLVVPGVIWAIKFLFFSFVVVDREDLGPIEALKESSRLTQGEKGNLLLFGVIAYGIGILGFICLFIGLFWAIPTITVAFAFVYRKLSAHADGLTPTMAGADGGSTDRSEIGGSEPA
jgi:uncharacterized membrane protein